jgi:hypothetical protein
VSESGEPGCVLFREPPGLCQRRGVHGLAVAGGETGQEGEDKGRRRYCAIGPVRGRRGRGREGTCGDGL